MVRIVSDEPKTDTAPQSDTKPHIRTFASDVASLTGKPLPKNVVNVPAPKPVAPAAPVAPKEVAAPPPPKPMGPSREEVLARLRDTAAKPAAVIPSASPSVVPGIPPVSKAPAAQPLPTIHTYTSDFAEHAKRQGATPLSVLAAEQDAGGASAPTALSVKKKSAWIPILAGTLLILAGAASIYFAYYFITNRPSTPSAVFVPSLIFADEHVRIQGFGTELQMRLAELSTHALPEGGVAIVYITYASTTPQGKTVEEPATGGALVRALTLTAPDILLRNTEPASTVGLVRAGGETRPFMILRVASFERTFAGMLVWEKTMADDLRIFYPAFEVPTPEPVATTTATGTPATTTPIAPPAPPEFEDLTISNYDVRILKDARGRTLLLYGYRDKETLIIARNEAAFEELVARLSATRAQ